MNNRGRPRRVKAGLVAAFAALFALSAMAGAGGSERMPRLRARLATLFTRSVLKGPSVPAGLIPGIPAPYDRVLVSVVASLRSQEPPRNIAGWYEMPLNPQVGKSRVCPGAQLASVRRSHSGNPYTFVILPGSFATRKTGSFSNQTIAALDEKFGDPNLIVLSGYLSPEFLAGRCREIPWNGREMARDLFARLRMALGVIRARPELTGIIGFSGGGMLSIGVLAEDTEQAHQALSRVFGLGGAVFSPILHARTAFRNLDTRHDQSSVDPTRGLTTLDFGNLWMLLTHFGAPPWQDLPEIFQKNPADFTARTFNEFTVVDLAGTLRAIGKESKNPSYYDTYIRQGFRGGEGEFDRATDLRPQVLAVDRPLLIHFSKDDPVLSNSFSIEQPAEVSAVLTAAEKNPWAIVENPPYGGHVGILLEPMFADVLETFFGPGAR